jgi:hypothetical protein
MLSNYMTSGDGAEAVAKGLPLNDALFCDTPGDYRAYGLTISSEIRFEHFPGSVSVGTADVTVQHGEIFGHSYFPPASLQVTASPGRLLIQGIRSATILVTGGSAITVEPLPNGNHGVIRQLVLGWALGAVFHQRGMLPLHGSALCEAEDCFVLCAGSGVGKSTLAAAFLNKGFSYLDDNMAVVDSRGGIPYVVPGTPELRLWEDALPDLDFEHQVVGTITPKSNKFSISARRNFRSEAARLRKIFILNRTRDLALSFVNLSGADKFQALHENVFCARFIGNSAGRARLFRLVQELATAVAVVEVRLPGHLPSPDALCEMIMGAEMMQKGESRLSGRPGKGE